MNSIIVNLVDEATYIYDLIYSTTEMTAGSRLWVTNGDGYHVRSLTIRDIIAYLYHGIEDRTGIFLVWREDDIKHRHVFLKNHTLYGVGNLPLEFDEMALRYIDTTLLKIIHPYVMEGGSEYSMLLFSRSNDSLVIGIGTDIRIVEWEEGCRTGKLSPSWLPSSNPFKSHRDLDINYSTEMLPNVLTNSDSDDPNVVNSAILEMDKMRRTPRSNKRSNVSSIGHLKRL